MDEVVESVVVGSDTSGNEIGNAAGRLMGKVVSTLVIGAPVSDTLTTVSKIGTSSETDLVVAILSGCEESYET